MITLFAAFENILTVDHDARKYAPHFDITAEQEPIEYPHVLAELLMMYILFDISHTPPAPLIYETAVGLHPVFRY